LYDLQSLDIKPTIIREEAKPGTTKEFLGLFAAGEHKKGQEPLFRKGDPIGFYIAETVEKKTWTGESYYPETRTHDRYGCTGRNKHLEPRRSNYHMGLADERQLDGAAVRSAVAFANSLWTDLDEWELKSRDTAPADQRAMEQCEKMGWFVESVNTSVDTYLFWSPREDNVKDTISSRRIPPQKAVFNAVFVDALPAKFPALIAIADIYRGDEIYCRYDLLCEDEFSTQDREGNSLYLLWHSKNTDIYYHPGAA
jgi:hypothetical protein